MSTYLEVIKKHFWDYLPKDDFNIIHDITLNVSMFKIHLSFVILETEKVYFGRCEINSGLLAITKS